MPSRMALLAVPLMLAASAIVFNRARADDCPAGTVAITPATRAAATAAGIPTSAACWNPSDSNVGQATGEAHQFLNAHRAGSVNVQCLNAEFARRLQQLMQAVPGGAPRITDAYRSPQAQVAAQSSGASRVGPCGSYHQYGLAADFNNESRERLRWMRENAARFGLSPVTFANPTTGCTPSGFCDYGHIQIAGRLPPREQCGRCATGDTYAYSPNSGPQGAPLGLGDLTRGLFSGQQQPPPYQPAMQQPLTSSQPITSAFAQPSTSLIPQATAPTQTQATSSSSATSTSTNTNTNTNTNVNIDQSTTNPLAVSDRLEELAFGSGSVATTSSSLATSVPLVITGATAGTIAYVDGQEPPSQQSTTTIGGLPVGQETFTSSQPTLQEAHVYMSPTQLAVYQTLDRLKEALLAILVYLRPFGGQPQVMYE